jgi:hypothetical protein
VLNSIHYDSNITETFGIVSDVYVVLNVYEDQNVVFEYSDVKQQVYRSVEESYGSELQAYGKGRKKGSTLLLVLLYWMQIQMIVLIIKIQQIFLLTMKLR